MTGASRFSGGRLHAARRTASRVWAPIELVTTELGRAGTVMSSALVFPGLATRLGLRYVVGRLMGTRVAHARLSYEFGGVLQANPDPSARRRATILLIPSVLLVLIGLAFGLPILLEMRLLGVSLVPTTVNTEGATELVLERFVVRGTNDALGLWCAMSAWYAAALTRSDLQDVLAAGTADGKRGPVSKALLVVLAPFRAVTRVTDPLDRFFGIATGAVSLVLWFLVTGMAARLLF